MDGTLTWGEVKAWAGSNKVDDRAVLRLSTADYRYGTVRNLSIRDDGSSPQEFILCEQP